MEPVRNLISIKDMSMRWWEDLFSRCCDIIEHPGDYADSCREKVLAMLFYEPSTRTSFSFQSAILRLGGSVFGFSDPAATSVSKGETLADTVRITATYSDTIVIRSPHEGAPAAAALYCDVPIINAGDGSHLHPTQTLADLATIAKKRGGIKNMTIGICGDLKYGRAAHSLIAALSAFPGITFILISPGELCIPEYIRLQMRQSGQEFFETDDLSECIGQADILYMTRIQRERFVSIEDYRRLQGVYVLTKNQLQRARSDMLVMHPLPRYGEISPEVDEDPRAVYFEQARYGMYIRMALLLEFLHLPRLSPLPIRSEVSDKKCSNPVCITQTESYLPPLVSGSDSHGCMYCDKTMSLGENK